MLSEITIHVVYGFDYMGCHAYARQTEGKRRRSRQLFRFEVQHRESMAATLDVVLAEAHRRLLLTP
jgi:hypothetical protein